MHQSSRITGLAGALALAVSLPSLVLATPVLSNQFLRAEFSGPRLAALVDARTGFRLRFESDDSSLKVGGRMVVLTRLPAADVKSSMNTLSFVYNDLEYTIKVIYELRPDWRFLSKQIVIEPAGRGEYRVNEIAAFRSRIGPAIRDELPLSARATWGAALRFDRMGGAAAPGFGAFLLYQNPFNIWKRDGQSIESSYAPEIDWKPEYGPYVSDRFCIGLYPLSGVTFPARAVPEWTFVADYRKYLEENPRIDATEAGALMECVRSFLLYRPEKSVRVHVPWCENDYQIDVASPEGWTEFQHIIDQAVEVGCQYTLFTPANSDLSSLSENRDAWGWENLLFFAMGQKIRKNEWDPSKDDVPPSLQRILDYAKARNIKLVAYAYPSLPFLQDPEWTRWAGGKVGGYNGPDMGLRSFQDWWVGKLVDFARATGAGGYSFDHWWIAYDNASSRYSQWNGCRRILETLRLRLPGIVIDGRQQYMNFGPWTWLAGTYPHPSLTDEQPESFVSFPDLHTDRVSANRQRFAAWTYRVQRFCPPEILPGFMTHQTERSDAQGVMRRDRFRPRDWDLLGWKFSVLSSIGTAPFNHVVDYLPARDIEEFRAFPEEDKRWFRGWLDWTDRNASLLKRLKPIIGPPMIGRIDGTAACAGDAGYVFLFNPNYRELEAGFVLDGSIGLEKGERFILEELYPEAGRLLGRAQDGVWKMGDRVVLPVSGNEAVILAVRPAGAYGPGPLLFNVRGGAKLVGRTLALSGIEGEIGSERQVAVRLPAGQRIDALAVNGTALPFTRNGNLVTARVRFAGERFGKSQGLWTYDPSFTGGTVRASFRVPARILEQLRRRRQSWPVSYTEDDLLAPWLGSYRLLLYAHVAEPDDTKQVAITIDGVPARVLKAYNNIYGGSKRNFLGHYVDVSSLKPDKEHVVEANLPQLPPGRFQGLFFENVEPEYTSSIAK